MKQSNKLEKVCSHPDVPPPDQQVAKCALCMKPLGRDHMVTKQGKSFCCNAAADQYFDSDAQVQAAMARQKKGGFAKLVKLVIILAILGGIAYGGWYYMNNKDSVDARMKEAKEAVQDATN